jgi:hypothetical protein
LNDSDYILIQRKIFKKYQAQNLAVYKILEFNRMCSEICEHKNCELNYSTVKCIMKIVRKYMRKEKINLDNK